MEKAEKRGWRRSLQKSIRGIKHSSLRLAKQLENGLEALVNVETSGKELWRCCALRELQAVRKQVMFENKGFQLLVVKKQLPQIQLGTTVKCVGDDGENWTIELFGRAEQLTVPKVAAALKDRKEWTVQDVWDHILRPTLSSDQTAYIDRLQSNLVSKPFCGACVCQASESSFDGLVQALESHFEESSGIDVYVWVDVFCMRESELNSTTFAPKLKQMMDENGKPVQDGERAESFFLDLSKSIQRFDSFLVFFDSTEKPKVLQLAWCIWELFCASQGKKELCVMFDPRSDDDRINKVLDESDALLGAVAKMELGKLQCRNQHDLKVLKKLFSRVEGGFSAVKAQISTRLKRWLLCTVENAVKERAKGSDGTEPFATLLLASGNFMEVMDERDVALSYYEKAVDILQNEFKDGHLETAAACIDLANLYKLLNRFSDAAKMYSNALEIYRRLCGEQHLDTADAYYELGLVYSLQREYQLALECFQSALMIRKTKLGKSHSRTCQTLFSLAQTFDLLGRTAESLALYEQLLKIQRQTLGEKHQDLADTYDSMGSVLESMGKYPEAQESFEKALEIFVELLGENSLDTMESCESLANVLFLQGKHVQALKLYEKLLNLRGNTPGEHRSELAQTLRSIASIYEAQGQNAKALQTCEKVLEMLKEAIGENNVEVAAVYSTMGLISEKLENWTDAHAYFGKSSTIYVSNLGPHHPTTQTALLHHKRTESTLSS